MATIFGGAALVLCTAGSASALSTAVSFTSINSTRGNVEWVGGFEFTVGANNIAVDQLGFYDHNSNGLVDSHDVGIYEVNTQNLVASATIPSGTSATLDNMFRWVALNSPATLNANQTYRIAGNRSNSNDSMVIISTSNPTVNVDSAITINGAVSAFSPSLTYPNIGPSSSNLGEFAGNFSIASSAAVPFEFSPTFGLVTIGGIFGLSRLRKGIGNSKAINEISA